MNKDTMAKLIERGAVLKQLETKSLTQRVAGLRLGLSERQIRRLYKRYKSKGSQGLIHGNIGRQNKRKIPPEIESKAMAWLKEFGRDFGSTFAQEKLTEYVGVKASVGTIRTWRIKNGLHAPKCRKEKKQFSRRARKSLFGMMVQIDGSPHDWFGNRGEKCTLLTAIDDATGKIHARFAQEETTIDLMKLMRSYVERYGRPHMAYTDHGGPYKVNIGNTEGNKVTQLGRAFGQLDIELIHANSPQAKGRVERNHKTNQDRLYKEMGLRGISTIEAANEYLEKEYIPDFNRRFVVSPASNQDAHRSINGINLDTIFNIQSIRIVQNDGVVQFEKQLFQITKNRIYAQPKSAVTVHEHLDGTITLWSGSIQLGYDIITSHRPRLPKSAKEPKPLRPESRNWANGIYQPHRLKHCYESIALEAAIEGE
jgi:transposase